MGDAVPTAATFTDALGVADAVRAVVAAFPAAPLDLCLGFGGGGIRGAFVMLDPRIAIGTDDDDVGGGK